MEKHRIHHKLFFREETASKYDFQGISGDISKLESDVVLEIDRNDADDVEANPA
jgi:hypothetical protein